MLLLSANEHEVEYVNYKPKYWIGMRAKYLKYCELRIKNSDLVILFGSSGWLGPKRKWNELIELEDPRFVPFAIRRRDWCSHFRHKNYMLVDMESWQVWNMCKKYNIPFKSIRYIIDRGDKKVMPWGINRFWKKYQHKRMQKQFTKYLEDYHGIN